MIEVRPRTAERQHCPDHAPAARGARAHGAPSSPLARPQPLTGPDTTPRKTKHQPYSLQQKTPQTGNASTQVDLSTTSSCHTAPVDHTVATTVGCLDTAPGRAARTNVRRHTGRAVPAASTTPSRPPWAASTRRRDEQRGQAQASSHLDTAQSSRQAACVCGKEEN